VHPFGSRADPSESDAGDPVILTTEQEYDVWIASAMG